MNVLVNTSARFSVTPDGQLWAPSESLAYSYWARFLDVFDEVILLGRVVPTEKPLNCARRACGDGIEVIPLPDFYGTRQFAAKYLAMRKAIHVALLRTDAVYLSLPCVIGDLICRMLPRGRPFGVGVCGDPYDVFAPGAQKHPLRPLLRWWLSHRLRLLCRRACASTYVTKQVLQSRYPPKPDSFSTYYSSIHLPAEAIAETSRYSVKSSGAFEIIHVGTFDTWYKGPDILIRAVASCLSRGLDLKLTLIGGGRYRSEVEKMAGQLCISDRVRFLGQLPLSEAVRSELDGADLFILPSRTEGLPKAMVEAMARGLPCIGTTVGGMPELLSPEDLVPPGDAPALSRKIEEVLANCERRIAMSARNLATAQQYRSEVLRSRRIAFYRAVRDRTKEWIEANSIASLDSI